MRWLVPDLQKPSSAGIMGLDAFLHEGREILIVHPKFGSPYAPCILPLLLKGVLSKELWEWGPHWRSGCCDMLESIFDVRWCGIVKDRIDRKETEANMLIADSFRNLLYAINQKPRGNATNITRPLCSALLPGLGGSSSTGDRSSCWDFSRNMGKLQILQQHSSWHIGTSGTNHFISLWYHGDDLHLDAPCILSSEADYGPLVTGGEFHSVVGDRQKAVGTWLGWKEEFYHFLLTRGFIQAGKCPLLEELGVCSMPAVVFIFDVLSNFSVLNRGWVRGKVG